MTVDELLDRAIDKKVQERVAQIQDQIELLRPWLQMDQVKVLTGYQDTAWIKRHFIVDDVKGPRAPLERKLVKKIGGRWCFKNPEFFQYLHDEYWDEQEG